MIKSIWLARDYGFVLSYDGKEFLVIGDSQIAESIRRMSKDKDSLFSELFSGSNNDFDPVRYWYESSINFADEAPPRRFSKKLFDLFVEELQNSPDRELKA
jgi:hypothetical protein